MIIGFGLQGDHITIFSDKFGFEVTKKLVVNESTFQPSIRLSVDLSIYPEYIDITDYERLVMEKEIMEDIVSSFNRILPMKEEQK